MNETQLSNKLCRMRTSGKWIIVSSVLLAVCMIFGQWFHLPEPSASLDSWEISRIPWNLWAVTLDLCFNKGGQVLFGVPIAIGLGQFLVNPNLLMTILRWLAYIWLTLLWCYFLLVTYMMDILPNL